MFIYIDPSILGVFLVFLSMHEQELRHLGGYLTALRQIGDLRSENWLSYLRPVEEHPFPTHGQISTAHVLTRLSLLIYSSFSSKTDPFLSVCLHRRHSVMLKAELSACNVASRSGCFPLQILQT